MSGDLAIVTRGAVMGGERSERSAFKSDLGDIVIVWPFDFDAPIGVDTGTSLAVPFRRGEDMARDRVTKGAVCTTSSGPRNRSCSLRRAGRVGVVVALLTGLGLTQRSVISSSISFKNPSQKSSSLPIIAVLEERTLYEVLYPCP